MKSDLLLAHEAKLRLKGLPLDTPYPYKSRAEAIRVYGRGNAIPKIPVKKLKPRHNYVPTPLDKLHPDSVFKIESTWTTPEGVQWAVLVCSCGHRQEFRWLEGRRAKYNCCESFLHISNVTDNPMAKLINNRKKQK